MIDAPEKWIKHYIEAGCDNITFHIEATNTPIDAIRQIKDANVSCGIAIKPDTPITKIKEYLHAIDFVTVMTVEPGFGGQKLIEATVDKIRELKKLKQKSESHKFIIQADGGIGIDNIEHIQEVGLGVAVMGSAFFNEKDYNKFYKKIKSIVKNMD